VAEWVAARAAVRHAQTLEAPLAGAGAYFAEDPSWFGPPLERTVVERGEEAPRTTLPSPSED
jgi:hypothetical protein